MPKFFVKQEQILDKEIIVVGQDVSHIKNVLRMKEGDRVNVCNIDSKVNYVAEIMGISGEVRCKIIETINSEAEPDTHISLFQGLPKADKMELIIEKCTEIGVSEFIPVEMKRCVVKLDEKNKQKKLERWQKIAETAAKQSGRDYIPKIERIVGVKDICNVMQDYDIVLLAYEKEKTNTLKENLASLNEERTPSHYVTAPLLKGPRIAIIVGPEGGLDKSEVEHFKEAGVKAISLGKRILRTETAGIVMAANILYELENP